MKKGSCIEYILTVASIILLSLWRPILAQQNFAFFEEIPVADKLTPGAIGHRGHVKRLLAIAFNQDGKLLATGDEEGIICLWDVETGQPKNILKIRLYANRLRFRPDGSLFCADSGRCAHIYDLSSNRVIFSRVFKGANDIAISPDGTKLAVAQRSTPPILLWDLSADKEVARLEKPSYEVERLSFGPDASWIVAVASDKTLRIWPVSLKEESRLLLTLPPKPKEEYSSEKAYWLSPSGDRLAIRSGSTITVLDTATGRVLTKSSEPPGDKKNPAFIEGVIFSSDSHFCAYGYSKYKGDHLSSMIIKIYDIDNRQIYKEIDLGDRYCSGLGVFKPGGRQLALVVPEHIQMVEIENGATVMAIPFEEQKPKLEALGAHISQEFEWRVYSVSPVQRSIEPSGEYWRIDMEIENHFHDRVALKSPSSIEFPWGDLRAMGLWDLKACTGILLIHLDSKKAYPLVHLVPQVGGLSSSSIRIELEPTEVQKEVILFVKPHERISVGLVFAVPRNAKMEDFVFQLGDPMARELISALVSN